MSDVAKWIMILNHNNDPKINLPALDESKVNESLIQFKEQLM